MKLMPALVALVVFTVVVSVALAQPSAPKKPKPRPNPPATTTTAPAAEATTTQLTTYPPPSTESSSGKFIVKCGFSHRKQVDPIVVPGPLGTLSAHMHDFFGNRSTDSNSTYASMIVAGTTCSAISDTAAYWVPTLRRPDGSSVNPLSMYAYYRNKPVSYGTTIPFPPDFRLITGGVGTFPARTFWYCFDVGSSVKYAAPPLCSKDHLVATFYLANCWDGVNRDSADHRSHVVYPVSSKCPQSHPVKVPNVRLFLHFPTGTGGPGYVLSDGTTLPHADFWNTWRQAKLEQFVRECLNAGVECGRVQG